MEWGFEHCIFLLKTLSSVIQLSYEVLFKCVRICVKLIYILFYFLLLIVIGNDNQNVSIC